MLPVPPTAAASAAHHDTLHTRNLGERRASSTPALCQIAGRQLLLLWFMDPSFSNLRSKGAGKTSWKTVRCSQLMLVALWPQW